MAQPSRPDHELDMERIMLAASNRSKSPKEYYDQLRDMLFLLEAELQSVKETL